MKPINEMSILELADSLQGTVYKDYILRLRKLHEKHRWIPVEERLPDNEEVVRVYTGLFDTYGESYGRWCDDANRWFVDGTNCGGDVTHWKHLDKPEGV